MNSSRYCVSYYVVFLALLGLLTFGFYGQANAASAAVTGNKLSGNASAIAPHKARYKVSLSHVQNGSSITDVNGSINFSWSDTCDGWAVEQHVDMVLTHSEGEESEINSSILSWESYDGTRYSFTVRRNSEDGSDENMRGSAVISGKGIKISYTMPTDTPPRSIDGSFMFPSAHTLLLIDRINKGDVFFTSRVFDGADSEGMQDVSSFVLRQPDAGNVPDRLKDNQLLRPNAYPVRMAFFNVTPQSSEPDYEMKILLQPNGVVRFMTLDYGEFSANATLESIDAIEKPRC